MKTAVLALLLACTSLAPAQVPDVVVAPNQKLFIWLNGGGQIRVTVIKSMGGGWFHCRKESVEPGKSRECYINFNLVQEIQLVPVAAE